MYLHVQGNHPHLVVCDDYVYLRHCLDCQRWYMCLSVQCSSQHIVCPPPTLQVPSPKLSSKGSDSSLPLVSKEMTSRSTSVSTSTAPPSTTLPSLAPLPPLAPLPTQPSTLATALPTATPTAMPTATPTAMPTATSTGQSVVPNLLSMNPHLLQALLSSASQVPVCDGVCEYSVSVVCVECVRVCV